MSRRGAAFGVFGGALLLAALALGCDRPAPPPAHTGKIVSLAPSITEILFAVGAGGELGGVTSHCDYPPEAAALPKVGGYNTPNVELIVGLAPRLVICPREGALERPVRRLEALGIRVEAIPAETLEDTVAAVERVGALAGREAAGRDLAARLRARIEAVRRAVAGRPRPRVLLVVDVNPLVVAGPGTFAHALIETAGAENAAAGAFSMYPRVSEEGVLAMAPSVVVDASYGMSGGEAPFPGAVRMAPELLIRPGPRLVDGLERLARALHPEAFPP